ncbi:MAG: hypothetical protein ACTHNU_12555 [Gaiellales bacterium]
MALSPRQQKKQQMVRRSYTGIGVGVVLLVLGIIIGSIVLDVIGVIVVLLGIWAARALRTL